MKRQNDKIKFNFNRLKANEVILFLSNKDKGISKMRLLKFLFFADLYHLQKFGRPIVGDRYVAMVRGPVLSEVYNMIKRSGKDYDVEKNTIFPKRQADLNEFSKSDIEALEYAFNQYSQYETEKLSELTHKEKCWLNAVDREPKSKNAEILWEDMINDPEILEELKENSRIMVI